VGGDTLTRALEVDEQRRLESGHFKLFREGVADFPDGEVWHEDRPDFRIFADGYVLGVEHAQLLITSEDGDQPIAIERSQRRVAEIAREHAELRGLPPVFVSLVFANGQGAIAKARQLPLARRLASICAERFPRSGERVEIERDYRELHYLPREIESLHIDRVSDRVRHHHWDTCEAGMVLGDARDLLQNEIRAKAPKLPDYLAQCDRCWLLLVADALEPSGFIEPSEESLAHVYESSFERTYFMNALHPPVLLRTKLRVPVALDCSDERERAMYGVPPEDGKP
jgi:hypothetical protein